jgi:thioredoxin reductase (NADPH)
MAEKEKQDVDLLILGGGIAGLTAGIYGARYALKVAVIANSFGGTGNLAGHIENWPGFEGAGSDLMRQITEQAKRHGVNLLECEIKKVWKEKDKFFAETNGKIISGKAVIFALGMQNRKLNIKGEEEFLGKGVSYCATCDGMFFKNKKIAIIGGADSAAKAAIYLSDIASKVYIIYRKGEMRCEPVVLEKIKQKPNVEIHYFSNPGEIIGDKKVKALKLLKEEGQQEMALEVDGVFIEIGATPTTELVKELGVTTDETEYIKVDREYKTNVPGVFAAGDNTDTKFKQLIVAAGAGAIAAKSAFDFIKMKK